MPDSSAAPKDWRGRFYEDLDVGDTYRSRIGRTVTEADNVWFTCLTMNTNQMHFNTDYAGKTRFERPLVNSTFTLALVAGLTVPDTSENAAANLGWSEIKLPGPSTSAIRSGLRVKYSTSENRKRVPRSELSVSAVGESTSAARPSVSIGGRLCSTAAPHRKSPAHSPTSLRRGTYDNQWAGSATTPLGCAAVDWSAQTRGSSTSPVSSPSHA
jgi:acyl dehydratase